MTEDCASSGCPVDPDLGATLIAAAGTARFGPLLLEAARRAGDIAEVFAYRACDGRPPQTLLSCGDLSGIELRTRLYAQCFYAHDPAAARGSVTGGYSCHVRTVEIQREDYREVCFERPRFTDKFCFGWRAGSQRTVISFYRRDGGEQGAGVLAPLATLSLAALCRSADRPPLVTVFEQRLAADFPQLTPRERQVCARTVAGWSAASTATSLGLTRASVLTYRQRAYHKLGFSRAADFLERLVH